MGEKLKMAALFVFSFFVFISPAVIRLYYLGNPAYIGVPTFMHARISEYMMRGDFQWYDPLSYGGRFYSYPPLFSAGMALLGIIADLKTASIIYVPLFGALGMVFFYLIAKKYLSKKYSIIATATAVFVPGTIFLNSHISTRAPGVALGLVSLYLVMREKKTTSRTILASGLITGVSFLFHFEPPLFFLVIMAAYIFYNERNLKKFAKIAIISVFIAMLWYGPFLAEHGLSEKNELHDDYRVRRYSLESPTVKNYIWEIGNIGYLNVLISIFAAIGFFTTKERTPRLWIGFAFLLTLAFERLFIYIAFPAVLMAFMALVSIERQHARIAFKFIFAAFIAYTVIFGLHRVWAFANDYPTKDHYEAFSWIKDNTPQNATIFSDWQWGHWISGIAGRKNFMDGYAEYAPEVNERLEELNRFYSYCLVPGGYGIEYIYIEDWFVWRNNITCLDKFSLVYNRTGMLVYKV